jgi:hypothetical protein
MESTISTGVVVAEGLDELMREVLPAERMLAAVVVDVEGGKLSVGALVDQQGRGVSAAWGEVGTVESEPFVPTVARELALDLVPPPHPGRFVTIEPGGSLLFVPRGEP